MPTLDYQDMFAMQMELWEKHKDKWSPMEAAYAARSLLWMVGEVGEVIDIIKKYGDESVMNDEQQRASLLEEMIDVQMYFNDVLLRFGYTPEDVAEAYRRKHEINMGRNFSR